MLQRLLVGLHNLAIAVDRHRIASWTIRRDLRPGDLGAIVAHHGRVYIPEHGVDSTFEGSVAATIADAVARGWPGPREGVWIVERDGVHAGSLGLTDEGDGEARLRWFLLDPGLRRQGLGRRMLEELLAEADRFGYQRIVLETFSDLHAAAHLYLEHGFELVWAETKPRWGRAEFTYQRYELELRQTMPPGSAPRQLARPR
jgi:GNAT superfamily N-acetyltransferase